ncbi:MAG: DoxX family protein [Bacteroidales bacterium]|nr:DoxX family protein [Bacteroidales bacterium]
MMHVLLWLSRIITGAVFVFSGFVKAIDPLGSAYKFQDYFLAFGTEWLFFSALPMAVALSTLELVIGIGILFGISMRYSAWGGLLFMAFFTPLTLYIAITDPVPDCGCFGDAIIISNWSTFFKNIIILAAAIIVFIYRDRVTPLWSEKGDKRIIAAITAAVIGLSVYCLLYLPIIDFRPWKTGNNITEEGLIDNFFIEDDTGNDLTWDYYFKEDYWFLVSAYDLNRTNARAFERNITPLARDAEAQGYELVVLSGSPDVVVEAFRHDYQTPYPFYLSDEIALKTIIRSNPGLVLIKDGVVVQKWPFRRIPAFEQIEEKYIR